MKKFHRNIFEFLSHVKWNGGHMKFKTKLYVGLGSIFALIIILLGILLSMLNQLTVNMNVVVNELSDRVKLTSAIQYETNNMDKELREVASHPPEDIRPKIINDWEQSRLNINKSLASLQEIDKREKSQELIAKFNTLYEAYEGIGQQVITLQKVDPNADLDTLLWGDFKLTQQRMLQLVDLLHTLQEQEMKNELYRTRQTYNLAVQVIYAYAIVGFLIGLGIALWLIRGMIRNLNRVTSVMTSVSEYQGMRFPRIEVTSKDEIGAISEAFNGMAQSLEEYMEQEQELKKKAEEHSWLKSRIAEITAIYPTVEDFQTLAKLFIEKITPMVRAQYGTFYINEGSGEQQYLKRMASYAFIPDAAEFDGFHFGEGLVGQCAIEKKPILITEVPDDYMKITSGTGRAAPKNILILPAEFEDEVVAVIEFASFEPFSDLEQLFLHEVMSHIGITINSIGSRMKVRNLLHESQVLTEEMQSQSEELQMQQEELRTMNEQLEEQYQNSEQRKEELEKISRMLEEKAQQLVLSSQYKSEFLANMSHELRTPLNSLLILAQMLAEKDYANLTSKQLEYIQTIYSSGNDLLHLINDILDLAKVEAGKIEVIPTAVRLQDVKQLAERQFLPLARQKGIRFSVQLDEDVPEVLCTDEHRLNQVLKNLLSNAFKFTETGSVSLIIHKAVQKGSKDRFSVEQKDSALAFSVIDTGIGIPKEKQALIFDAFKQADGTTSRKYGGTGLGLSISREIAQLLGGFIEMDSEEGAGSSFVLYLPNYELNSHGESLSARMEVAAGQMEQEISSVENKVSAYPYETNESNTSGNALMRGKKILIVDDDMRNIFALTAALEGYEMEVLFAENGEEGIEVLQENRDIDLLMIDIMMPKMDGFEAMRLIRGMSEFAELPIIALTAKAMKHDREQCIEAGASDYISKPINLDQLFSLMQVWLYR